MDHPRSSANVYRSLVFVILFCCLIAYGLFVTRDNLIPFFMARPWLNGAILALAIVGLVLSLRELARIIVQAKRLDSIVAGLQRNQPSQQDGPRIDELGHGLVGDRCLRILGVVKQGSGSVTEAAGVLSDADAQAEEGRGALVLYLIGVMVFLGLIGTFWGLLMTVSGVKDVLAAMEPERVDDATAFIAELKSSIGGLLGGMSTAFSTSLFGLGGSVVLGFVDVQTRQARSRFLADLDRFVVSVFLPAVSPRRKIAPAGIVSTEGPESTGDQLYHIALQETFEENLRKLTDVIAAQSSNDERVTNSLVEMKGLLENLREEEVRTREAIKSANQAQGDLIERADNLGRHMERLVNEVRLSRDSSMDAGRATQDSLKMVGQQTNKTLARGFSDVAEKLDRVREGLGKRNGPEREGE